MGMREQNEADGRQDAGVSQAASGRGDMYVTGSPIGSGMTAEVVSGMTKNKKETPKADSESGRSSISSFPRRRKSGKGDESGRSMVETLGVLAIMGLLAEPGIMAQKIVRSAFGMQDIIIALIVTMNQMRFF